MFFAILEAFSSLSLKKILVFRPFIASGSSLDPSLGMNGKQKLVLIVLLVTLVFRGKQTRNFVF